MCLLFETLNSQDGHYGILLPILLGLSLGMAFDKHSIRKVLGHDFHAYEMVRRKVKT
jgi:hypothetical protein